MVRKGSPNRRNQADRSKGLVRIPKSVVALGLSLLSPAMLGACRREVPLSSTSVEEPLGAELSGCAAIVRQETNGPRATATVACALPEDRRVRIFVPDAVGRVEFLALPDASTLEATRIRPAAGGELFMLRVPDHASSVEVRRTPPPGHAAARASTRVYFTSTPRPAWYAEAQALREQGKLDEATSLAERGADAARPVSERAAAEGLLARIAMRRGDSDASEHHFRAAIQLDERAGIVSDRADDAFALTFLLHRRARRYSEARRILDELGGALADYPDGRAREPLYRGQVAWETGDIRAATQLLKMAAARAEKLGADRIRRAAHQVLGMVACSAGSTHACVESLREAERELDRAEAGAASACERAELEISLGFAELESAESTGEIDLSRLGKADERGLAALDAGCPEPYMRVVALEHLALAAVFVGDAAGAKAKLREAKAVLGCAAPERRANDARAEPPSHALAQPTGRAGCELGSSASSTELPAPALRIGDAVMWLDIEGRIAELEGDYAKALDRLDAAHTLARGAALRTQQWRALLRRGHVLESMRRSRGAIATYREAESVLDEVVSAVPFGEGRASAASDGGESARRVAKLLLDGGRANEALDVVRHARARLVRSLETTAKVAALEGARRERWEKSVSEYRRARELVDADAEDDWKRSRAALDAAIRARASMLHDLRARLDEALALATDGSSRQALPALPESDVTLAFVRLGRSRRSGDVVGFVHSDGRTRAYRVLSPVTRETPAATLGEVLLGPARNEIEREPPATRLRVMTDDALAWIDVHSLPLDGKPLVTRAPVVYGVDLAARPSYGETRGDRSAPLVVADPTGDLPSAREEGAAVVRALAAPHTRALVGRDATAARVRASLGESTLFHYAGHGVFRGRDGAESALPLAQGGALTLGDVLTLERAPRHVVLSGCETGGRSFEGADDDDGAASMALAFLAAGAEIVVAPVREVDDRSAGALAASLHRPHEDVRATEDLATELRRAQLDAFERAIPGWEAFRAFAR